MLKDIKLATEVMSERTDLCLRLTMIQSLIFDDLIWPF